MANINLLNQQNRLTRAQAASYLGVKDGTLAVWAVTGRYSIPYYKIGRLVYYNRNDLDDFLAGRRIGEPLQAV